VLQNLGKAERTTDEQFDELVIKIERQQESAHHLQKELKKYLHALEALSAASKSFYSAVEETYEAEWTEEKNFSENLKTLWVNYLSRLHDKVVDPMLAYQASFPTLKAKINKRGRKLMYYDNAKHSVDVIQMAKKKDEAKVHKAHEDLSNAKQIYLRINNELHQELPDFHNSRVTFYAQLFGDLFDIENTFHGEIAKVKNDAQEDVKINGIQEDEKVNEAKADAKENGTGGQPDVPDYPPPEPPAEDNTHITPSETPEDHHDDVNVYDEPKSPKPKEEEKEDVKEVTEEESKKEEKPVYKSPASNQPVKEAPPNLLYQVQATHPYNGEDVDELSFDTGEFIWVIPYENEEEQDDGWVMGIKQSDGVKGVFPENFTRKLQP
ncbi:hypothetical protein LOTGIDRAFT_123818, partial [Lottia gigantea]